MIHRLTRGLLVAGAAVAVTAAAVAQVALGAGIAQAATGNLGDFTFLPELFQ
jgi:hypothetical protein